jgi:outer membrane receptor protein involved in Fe transport
MQFNSTFGNNLANEARISYLRVRDHREFKGPPFPAVAIVVGPRQQVRLGPAIDTPINMVNQDVFEVTNNISYFTKHHQITFGTHNEFFAFENHFIRGFYGSYEFNTIADFERGRPSSYFFTYSLTSNPKQAAKWNAYQLGFYVQDEWRMKSNLNFILGARMDVP